MKITCPTCSARYSIDDAKVKGKAFKFTCKKCGQTHVYRGGSDGAVAAPQEPAPAPAAAGYAEQQQAAAGGTDDAVWHVAVGEEQQGPYTTEQIREYIQTDQLDPESYLWREGLEDWLSVAEVPEFADLYQGDGAAPPEAPQPGDDQMPTSLSPFAAMTAPAQGADAGDLFGFGGQQSEAPAESPGPFGAFRAEPGAQAAVASRGGADLFGAQQGSPFEGGAEEQEEDVLTGGDPAAQPAPGASPRGDARQMVGARNENSILFSLASLQSLASHGGRPQAGAPAAAAAAAAAAARPGFASGEGSGLIDIRAVASSFTKREDKPDDIFGLGGGGVGSPVAVPVLMKPVRRDDDSRKPMFIMVGIIGAFAVTIVVLVIFLVGRGKDTVPVVVLPNSGDAATVIVASNGVDGGGTAAPQPGDESDAGEAKVEPEVAPAEDAVETDSAVEPASDAERVGDAGEEPPVGRDAGGTTVRRDGGPERRDTGGATVGPDARGPPPERDAGRERDTGGRPDRAVGSFDSIFGARDAGSTLPENPSREEVRNKLEGVRGAVRACTGGQAGSAQASITILGSSGRVSGVTVSGDFTGNSATCIGNAIRGLRFSEFSKPSLTVNYTYRF